MIRHLEATGDYRVLRKIKPRDVFDPARSDEKVRIGVVLDLETTGLDTTADEVIEAEVTELTGITPEMVAGHRIDPAAMAAFLSDVVVVIAHNAGFDRPIAER